MSKGAIAAGHPLTAQAAKHILQQGGNAYDAIIAAVFAACVTEPVLASLGGGGYLLAQSNGNKPLLYDFFVQTPKAKAESCDFFPISADFGPTRQTFHIGLASMATPGIVRGLFAIHRDLGHLPMTELVAPAIHYAREGVIINDFQAYVLEIIKPILLADQTAPALFQNQLQQLLKKGEIQKNPWYADFLEYLAHASDRFFYEGEISESVDRLCREKGGWLRREDFKDYKILRREPLQIQYKSHDLFINPPPSSGGILIGFALKLIEKMNFALAELNQEQYIGLLAQVLQQTSYARSQHKTSILSKSLLDDSILHNHLNRVDFDHLVSRGTTHISITDTNGNIASLSVSNGEGCGSYIPNSGIMMNNMLGEEDLNPDGFHLWKENTRMTSMLAPCIIHNTKQNVYAIGSGGSNRLRTAILQVLINLIDFHMPLQQAIDRPRIHFEENVLHLEGEHEIKNIQYLKKQQKMDIKTWNTLNLYFGGTHACGYDHGRLIGAGDPRRGGTAIIV